jgi:uncharacterized protein (TIGR02646 family)
MAFEFEQGLYGHPTVKQQLETAQWNKCCYCEIRIVSEHGDVEHFRPKAGVRQAEGERLHRPGYFWLVYTWSNLLYACSKCNRTYKRDLFPLEDLASRADALRDGGSTAKEALLLVDPSGEEPEASIEFDEERALPRSGARRGRVTIDLVGLNRMELLAERRERLEKIRLKFETLLLVRAGKVRVDSSEGQGHLRGLCREILSAAEARAVFSAMIRCALRRWLAPAPGFPCSEEQLVAWALAGAGSASK